MIKDQLDRTIPLEGIPERIICLVPSLTELLFDLGLGDRLVGRTKFCIHPKHQVSQVIIIGGTKKVHLNEVEALNPDFILANKEENVQADIEYLEKTVPVYLSNISSSEDTFQLIDDLADIFNISQRARDLKRKLKETVEHIKPDPSHIPLRALYLIWQNPYMAAGSDSYISSVMKLCGLTNVLEELGEEGLRYPEITTELIQSLNPEIILLSTEPFPFKNSHALRLENQLGIWTVCVDGEFFSWYGTRMIHSLKKNRPILEFLRERK